jgi:hypothetical protein
MNNSRRVTVEGAFVALLVVTSAPLEKLREAGGLGALRQ